MPPGTRTLFYSQGTIMNLILVNAPIDDQTVESLHRGDEVLLSGTIYTARDAAHKRLCALIAENKPLPLNLNSQVLYFVGPSPAKPGHVIGSAGPTTSGRMDAYSPILLEKAGLKAMIGKGDRNESVIASMIKYRAVYFAATGGAAVLLSRCIKKSTLVCFEDLGPEAIFELTVEKMPLVVAIDCFGNNIYSRLK
jgi:fumarate hydratase subunit beta